MIAEAPKEFGELLNALAKEYARELVNVHFWDGTVTSSHKLDKAYAAEARLINESWACAQKHLTPAAVQES